MASFTQKSSRRFNPERWVQDPDERRRYSFYTTPWGGETPSSPSIVLFDSNNVDVTSTYTSTTYLVSDDADNEVVGADVIWTKFITGLIPDRSYKLEVTFTLGGNTFVAFGWIDCIEFGSRLLEVKETALNVGYGEKVRYQLDTRPWRLPDNMNTSLSLNTTLTSPVFTLYNLNGEDKTSTYTTNDSGTAPTEISSHWVRTLFIDDLNPAGYRGKIQFVLQQNTYVAWMKIVGEA